MAGFRSRLALACHAGILRGGSDRDRTSHNHVLAMLVIGLLEIGAANGPDMWVDSIELGKQGLNVGMGPIGSLSATGWAGVIGLTVDHIQMPRAV